MWSPVEKTALAEAELEYSDHTSTTIFAKFKLVECPLKALIGNFIVIWTTTPWTIPGNRALAYNNEIDYVAININQVSENSIAQENQIIIVSEILLEDICSQCGITEYDVKAKLKGYELKGSIAKHPMADAGYDYLSHYLMLIMSQPSRERICSYCTRSWAGRLPVSTP